MLAGILLALPASRAGEVPDAALCLAWDLPLGTGAWRAELARGQIRASAPPFADCLIRARVHRIHENLARCCRGAVRYFNKPREDAGSNRLRSRLPPSMTAPACPGKAGLGALGPEPGLFLPEQYAPGGDAHVLGLVGLVIFRPEFACYRIEVDEPGRRPKPGRGIVCHAWSDLDGDGRRAHWQKRAVWSREQGFRHLPVQREDGSGEL
ncbi:MAG: hypothetical protein JXR96_12595 [Deltaproteobacteria bacterium]|nr:hypothetical protein [Deltaproteobacteria bacterium]